MKTVLIYIGPDGARICNSHDAKRNWMRQSDRFFDTYLDEDICSLRRESAPVLAFTTTGHLESLTAVLTVILDVVSCPILSIQVWRKDTMNAFILWLSST